MAVLAVADHGNLLHAPDMYMEKIADRKLEGKLILMLQSFIDNLKAVAKAKNKDIEDLVVAVLDRERHERIINKIRHGH